MCGRWQCRPRVSAGLDQSSGSTARSTDHRGTRRLDPARWNFCSRKAVCSWPSEIPTNAQQHLGRVSVAALVTVYRCMSHPTAAVTVKIAEISQLCCSCWNHFKLDLERGAALVSLWLLRQPLLAMVVPVLCHQAYLACPPTPTRFLVKNERLSHFNICGTLKSTRRAEMCRLRSSILHSSKCFAFIHGTAVLQLSALGRVCLSAIVCEWMS